VANLVLGSLGGWLGVGGDLPWLNAFVSLLVIMGSFAALYRLLPDAAVHWRDALQGAAFSSVGVLAAVFGVSLYFRYVRLNTALSVAGGLAVLLMGFNYLAQIFLFGAVISRVVHQGPDPPPP
jgi:membrane protein